MELNVVRVVCGITYSKSRLTPFILNKTDNSAALLVQGCHRHVLEISQYWYASTNLKIYTLHQYRT